MPCTVLLLLLEQATRRPLRRQLLWCCCRSGGCDPLERPLGCCRRPVCWALWAPLSGPRCGNERRATFRGLLFPLTRHSQRATCLLPSARSAHTSNSSSATHHTHNTQTHTHGSPHGSLSTLRAPDRTPQRTARARRSKRDAAQLIAGPLAATYSHGRRGHGRRGAGLLRLAAQVAAGLVRLRRAAAVQRAAPAAGDACAHGAGERGLRGMSSREGVPSSSLAAHVPPPSPLCLTTHCRPCRRRRRGLRRCTCSRRLSGKGGRAGCGWGGAGVMQLRSCAAEGLGRLSPRRPFCPQV
jgi:hypothetical protein